MHNSAEQKLLQVMQSSIFIITIVIMAACSDKWTASLLRAADSMYGISSQEAPYGIYA
jgi:hypothetical protein